jgi:hypothetical protein
LLKLSPTTSSPTIFFHPWLDQTASTKTSIINNHTTHPSSINIITSTMAYTFAKENSSDAELQRFAACFLNLKDFSQVRLTQRPPPSISLPSCRTTTTTPRSSLRSLTFAQVDWTAAASQFDPKVKPESFKTVTLRALKKAQTGGGVAPAANGAEGDGAGDGGAKAGAKGKDGGRKRKAEAEAEADGEEGGGEIVMEKGKGKGKKGKGGAAKKGKKAKAEVEEDGEGK